MIQSRAQFGSCGAIVPFPATVFVYMGFMVFDTIPATQGIGLIASALKIVWCPLLIAVSIIIAVVGHDRLHFVQRRLAYLPIFVFTIITIVSIVHFSSVPLVQGVAVSTSGWNTVAFVVQFSIAAGYNISYAVYVSDYTRYFPTGVSAPKLITSVYSRAALSAVWLMSLGALLASNISNGDPILALHQISGLLFPIFGTISVLVSVLALISTMGVNAYGAMLTGSSAIDGFTSVRPTVRLRVIGLIVVGVRSVIVALIIPDNCVSSFNNFVLLMLYFLVPWTAVNLVDLYFVRGGKCATTEILEPNGFYRRWAWRGMVAYSVGFLAMIPFFSVGFIVGSIAQMLGGADFFFAVGLVVSGGVYLVFSRSVHQREQEKARVKSDAELEGAAQ